MPETPSLPNCMARELRILFLFIYLQPLGAWDSRTLWLQTEQCVKGQGLSQGKPGAPYCIDPPQHSRGWGWVFWEVRFTAPPMML